jgi:hypothetical protein
MNRWGCTIIKNGPTIIASGISTLSEILMIRNVWLSPVVNELFILVGKWSVAIYAIHSHACWITRKHSFYSSVFRILEIGSPVATGLHKFDLW